MTNFLNRSWPFCLAFWGLGISGGISPAIAAIPESKTISPAEVAPTQGLELSQINLPDTNTGKPDSTFGGGKRGGCLNRQAKTLFKSILPTNSNGEAIATTIANGVSLWWYMPENEAVRAEFSIFAQNNTDDTLVYHQVIHDVTDQVGLFKVDVPANTLLPDNSYWWDLTLTCNDIDRSGDIFSFGAIEQQTLNQVRLANDPAVLNALIATLRGEQSYLSLAPSEAATLASALESNPDLATITMVSDRLREHFINLRKDYAQLNQALRTAPQNPGVTRTELSQMRRQQETMLLELTQLSAYLGLWSDAVDFLASHRDIHGQEWRSLLESLFPGDDPGTKDQEDLIIQLLSQT